VPPGPGQATVPASAYNVAAQLLAVEAGVDANPPAARVSMPDGRWLTVHAARLGGGGIAVTIEPTTTADRLDLFTRAHALSTREAELLGRLATGTDTRELARLMHLSEHTVQDYLKSIFAKTGTRSRRTLLSRAVG
jgi:DNA-binding CsgD family transcriptional regulator